MEREESISFILPVTAHNPVENDIVKVKGMRWTPPATIQY